MVETDGVLLKVKLILRMSPHEYQQILMNVLMVLFLVLPFSCHFESSGEDISTDGTNRNSVDEINAVRVVGPTSCFSNTTQEKTSDDACL